MIFGVMNLLIVAIILLLVAVFGYVIFKEMKYCGWIIIGLVLAINGWSIHYRKVLSALDQLNENQMWHLTYINTLNSISALSVLLFPLVGWIALVRHQREYMSQYGKVE